MSSEDPTDAPRMAEAPRDLFELCNQLAWSAGGPVLIHDAHWGVLAYSTLPQKIDEARRNVILRREVPGDEYNLINGIPAEQFLATSDDVLETNEVGSVPGIQSRRLVAPIRLLGVFVGSIWVAESDGPLSPSAQDALRAAAKDASFFFVAQQDARGREAEVFLSMLLEGGHGDRFIAQYLGVDAGSQFCVMTTLFDGDEQLLAEIRGALPGLIRAEGLTSLDVFGDRRVTSVVYSSRELADFESRLLAIADRLTRADPRVLCALGGAVRTPGHLPWSRTEAEAVETYLLANSRDRFASPSTVATGIALMRVVTTLQDQTQPERTLLHALSSLVSSDRVEALQTLDAYFEFRGNATEAARHLHMHPNTYRYRLTKVSGLLGIDLDDRETRLLLELELLALRYADPPAHRSGPRSIRGGSDRGPAFTN